jgi:hypothetical protein
MSGTIPIFPFYAFSFWAKKTFLLLLLLLLLLYKNFFAEPVQVLQSADSMNFWYRKGG